MSAALTFAQTLPAPSASTARLSDGTVAIPAAAPVTDLSGTLTPQAASQLTQRLAEFEKAHGAQIVILLVPSTQPEPIADFTNRVGDAWKLGRRGVGDGVLVVVAVQDRKAWISVARSLEGAIPDVISARIVREAMAPHFKTGDYAGGLNAGLDRLFERIQTENLAPGQTDQAAGGDELPAWMWLVIIVLFVVISAMRQRGGRQVIGHRRDGLPIFIPGGWGGGGSRGGGWSSGGGGDFSGGGGGGDW